MTATPQIARNPTEVETSDFIPDLSFHLSAHPRPARLGSGSLTLSVGGISIRLSGLDAAQIGALRERYGIFCTGVETGRDPGSRGDAGPAADLRIQVTAAARETFLRVRSGPGAPEYYRVDLRWQGDRLLAASYEWAGWLDRTAGTGGLSLARGTRSDAAAFHRSVENFLRVLYAHMFVARNGFLLHAAGLVRDGRAYLFFGPSGSGKTTVAALSPEALMLSDDLTLVRRNEAGAWVACSVPFRGLFAPQPASAEEFPVEGFFRLVKDTDDRLEPVKGARAVGEVVGSLPFVTERPEMAGLVMDTVAESTREIPVWRLHFRKDRSFWRAVLVDDFGPVRGITS